MSAEIKQQRPLPATLHWPNHGNPLIIDIHKKSLVARIGRHRSQSDATHPTHTPHADMFCVFNGIHLLEVHWLSNGRHAHFYWESTVFSSFVYST